MSISKFVPNAHSRFGRAVSKVRSKYAKQHRLQAARFLKDAKACDRTPRYSAATNAKWTKMANLEPIFEFLSK